MHSCKRGKGEQCSPRSLRPGKYNKVCCSHQERPTDSTPPMYTIVLANVLVLLFPLDVQLSSYPTRVERRIARTPSACQDHVCELLRHHQNHIFSFFFIPSFVFSIFTIVHLFLFRSCKVRQHRQIRPLRPRQQRPRRTQPRPRRSQPRPPHCRPPPPQQKLL